MSKRRKKMDLVKSSYDDEDFYPEFQNDMYQAPKGKKPRGRDKRKAGNHKTAYYD